tara:strand:+ start:215 stop:391 length:177 start_codon:yes stop_codon:yes gene_type:complete
MRLPNDKGKIKRVRISIREVDEGGGFKKGVKSENFIVIDCTPKEVKEFIIKKLKDEEI